MTETDTPKPMTNEELVAALLVEAEICDMKETRDLVRTAAERIGQQGTDDPEALKREFREHWLRPVQPAARVFADSIASDNLEWSEAATWYSGRTSANRYNK